VSKKLSFGALIVALPALMLASRELHGSGPTSFAGNFESGLAPWTSTGGSVQCANYGTASNPGHLRGDFTLDHTVVGQGSSSGRFDLPASPGGYQSEVCDLLTKPMSQTLPADEYYGLMLYVPPGWTIANNSFWGVIIAEYHFVGVWGAPVILELHPEHVTLALETGACTSYTASNPGCRYRSNADHRRCRSTRRFRCLPGYTAIPRGALVQGQWNEVILHVHWASDSSGQIQSWYRVKGAPGWTQSSNISGIPTVQWDNAKGCCTKGYVDLNAAAYTAALSAPLSLWLDNILTSPSFNTIATRMP
jgi:Polysaccharide lyase